MEKEMLLSKKEQLILNKQKLEENNYKKESLEKENEDLGVEYIEITKYLDRLDNIVFSYESLSSAKKILLAFFILGMVFGLVSGIVSLVEQATILSTVFSFTCPIVISTLISSIPYICTKLKISARTNLTLEEVLKQIEDYKDYKKVNREKYKQNIKQIENIKLKNSLINSNLDSLMQSLLNDKEAREEIMSEIMEVEPSKELVQSITDSMLERNKVKLKTNKDKKSK